MKCENTLSPSLETRPFPTRRLHATSSELPRNHIISMLRVVFNGCAEVPSKLREVFLLGYYIIIYIYRAWRQSLETKKCKIILYFYIFIKSKIIFLYFCNVILLNKNIEI